MRLEKGIHLDQLPAHNYGAELDAAASQAEARGWLIRQGPRWLPTALGRQHADALAQLFA